MRIPANIITENKYTQGNEYFEEKTNKNYQGYYYELNGLIYAGKTYKSDAIKLLPITDRNKMMNKGLSVATFSVLSGVTSQQLTPPAITSIAGPSGAEINTHNNLPERYFSSQVNIQPKIIKEINKETYDSIKNNPLFQTTFINSTQDIDQANKQMPGLKSFLLG
jgi:hypothetical protein